MVIYVLIYGILSGLFHAGARESKISHTGKWKKPVVDSVRLIELVISISKLTMLSPSLAVISCKGNISSNKITIVHTV